VFPLFRESPYREFSAALCLDGGAVKCDMGRKAGRKEARKEGNEPAATDREREKERGT